MRLGLVLMLLLVCSVAMRESYSLLAASASSRYADSSSQDPFPSDPDDSDLPIPCEENEVEGKTMESPAKSLGLFTLSANVYPIMGTILRERILPNSPSGREMLTTLHVLLI